MDVDMIDLKGRVHDTAKEQHKVSVTTPYRREMTWSVKSSNK